MVNSEILYSAKIWLSDNLTDHKAITAYVKKNQEEGFAELAFLGDYQKTEHSFILNDKKDIEEAIFEVGKMKEVIDKFLQTLVEILPDTSKEEDNV